MITQDIRQPVDYCLQKLMVQLHLVRGSRRRFVILDGMSGIMQPGRMTLLLGPPGSGKSTLLQALAGRYHRDGSLLVSTIVLDHDAQRLACGPRDRILLLRCR